MLKCDISKRWRELSGEKNWENLLNPLDPDLQKYLLHYGAMAQATYDTFISNKLSIFAGTSLFNRNDLLSQVGLAKANPFKYEVVKYIYATSNFCSVPDAFIVKSSSVKTFCKQSNWIGYVAVATDEGTSALGRRDILVAWRGTIEPIEWAKDADYPLVPADTIVGNNCKVHKGFLSVYNSKDSKSKFNKKSARQQVISELKKQLEKYGDEDDEEISITVTGHSLGGSLGTLCAADIVANGHNKIKGESKKECPVTAFLFACPKVGETNFKKTLESMKGLHILRVRNLPDVVPQVPFGNGYTDCGVEFQVNSSGSPFLLDTGNIATWHDLEAGYLHPLAIIKTGRSTDDKPLRDHCMVNKYQNCLKKKFLIPEAWWCEKNKGMVQGSNGSYSLHGGLVPEIPGNDDDDHENDSDDPENDNDDPDHDSDDPENDNDDPDHENDTSGGT